VKATGIVRRIDDLGRVVIPKEIRRTMRIREGDPLEIFVDREGEVILKKYSPIAELSDFAQEYATSLAESSGHVALITDRDAVVSAAGDVGKQWIGKAVSSAIEKSMTSRRTLLLPDSDDAAPPADEVWSFHSWVVAPIIAEGDPVGTVILGTYEQGVGVGPIEEKLVETAAGFLARQMEQ
jgi:AbrB family transcriptional regulator (stage V sporulation protein T)